MSLLMDALRKAEQAKRQAESNSTGPQPPLEPQSTLADQAGRPPVPEAGDLLPELPTKLELLDDQFGNVTGPSAPAKPRAPSPSPAKGAADAEARERQAAQQIFAAKQPQQPSRGPFYIGLAAATLIAASGIAGYVWWQMQPRSTLLATAPPPRAMPPQAGIQPPINTPPAAIAPSGAGAPVAAADRVLAAAEPGAGKPATAHADESVEEPAPRPTRTPRNAIVRGQLADAPTAPAAVVDASVRISRSRPQTDPALDRAYRHFQSGNLTAARSDYEQVLRRDPRNADALNGLAAIALRGGEPQAAENYYERALESDPQDTTAQAGLLGLRGKADPVQAESRLKSLTAAQPEAHGTQFALGNLYAGQGRWHEAQQAYFRAHTGDPENPDYQFNLAVSLDQLRQPRLALQYYQGALDAAASRTAAFDQAQAAARVRELQQP